MIIEHKTTISYTEPDIEKIFKKMAAEQYPGSDITVNFKIKKRTMGYGHGEYDEHYFDGVDVIVVPRNDTLQR